MTFARTRFVWPKLSFVFPLFLIASEALFASPLVYRFDHKSGRCQDQNGDPGYNVDYVGECGFLENKDFSKTDLSRKNFRGARLANADFGGADIQRSDFRGADLSQVNFYQGAKTAGALFNEKTVFSITETEIARLKFVAKTQEQINLEFSQFLTTLKNPNGRLETMKLFVAWDANLNLNHGFPLHITAQPDLLAEFNVLLDAGANPNPEKPVSPDYAYSGFVGAVKFLCNECIIRLQAHGGDINAPSGFSEEENTALLTASRAGNVAMVNFLLSRGAEINRQVATYPKNNVGHYTRATAISFAKNKATFDALKTAGADLRFKYLAWDDDFSFVTYAVNAGVNPNQVSPDEGKTALMLLVEKHRLPYIDSVDGAQKILAPFVQKGLDVNAQDSTGKNLLSHLLPWQNSLYAQALVKFGVNPKAPYDFKAPGMVAEVIRQFFKIHGGGCYPRLQEAHNLIVMLLNGGADANAVNTSGDSAILALVRNFRSKGCGASDNENVVASLLNALAKAGMQMDFVPPASSIDKYTAMTLAAAFSDMKWIETLLSYGAKINQADGYGETLLYTLGKKEGVYSDQSYVDLFEKLLKLGADVNATAGGHSFLETRIKENANFLVIKRLIDAGADLNFINGSGQNLAMVFLNTNNCRLKAGVPSNPTFDALIEKMNPNHQDLNGNLLTHYLVPERKLNLSNDSSSVMGLNASVKWFTCFAHPMLKHYDFNAKNAAGDTPLAMLFHKLKTPNLRETFYWSNETTLIDWIDEAVHEGLNVLHTDATGKSLATLAQEILLFETSRVLLKHGSTFTTDSSSPPAPVNHWTPVNACTSHQIEMGWRMKNGGCESPAGKVWSMPSYKDHCGLGLSGSYVCDEKNATGSVEGKEGYCESLNQGGRDDWQTPTAQEYLHAQLAGFFAETADQSLVIDPIWKVYTGWSGPYVRIRSVDGEWLSSPKTTGPYGYCVAARKPALTFATTKN